MRRLRKCGATLLAVMTTVSSLQFGSVNAYAQEMEADSTSQEIEQSQSQELDGTESADDTISGEDANNNAAAHGDAGEAEDISDDSETEQANVPDDGESTDDADEEQTGESDVVESDAEDVKDVDIPDDPVTEIAPLEDDSERITVTPDTDAEENIELAATTYTVTIDANGGIISNVNESKYDVKVPAGSTLYDADEENCLIYIRPFQEDYTKYVHNDKWSFDKAGNESIANIYSFVPTKDCTIYAVWTPIYTVTFDAGEGQLTKGKNIIEFTGIIDGTPMTCKYRSDTEWGFVNNNLDPYIVPDNPEYDGHAFDGWYKDAELTNGPYNINYLTDYIVTENTTFYAKYSEAYSVVFHGNEGVFTASPEANEVTVFVAKGNLLGGNVPTIKGEDGNAFEGWYTDQKLTPDSRINPYSFVVDKESIQLYAGFEKDACYKITFKSGKSNIKFTNGNTETVVYVRKGEPLTYGIDGVSKVNSSPIIDYDQTAKNTGEVPSGYWSLEGSDDLYCFSYMYMGGLAYMYPHIIKSGTDSDLPISGFIPTSDMTFTAEWVKAVKISFIPVDGYFSYDYFIDNKKYYVDEVPYFELELNDDDEESNPIKIIYTAPIGVNLDYIKRYLPNHYHYVNGRHTSQSWRYSYSDPECTKKVNEKDSILEDTVVYAKYEKTSGSSSKTNTVILHLCDGYSKNSKGEKVKEQSYSVSEWNTKKIFYGCDIWHDDMTKAFAGWYYDKDYKKPYPYVQLMSGKYRLFFPEKVTDLYAKFEDACYIRFNANGGYFDKNIGEYTNNPSELIKSDILEKTRYAYGYMINVSNYSMRLRNDNNYIFGGWYLDPECTKKAKIIIGDAAGYEYYQVSGDATLYAKWEKYSKVDAGSLVLSPNEVSVDIGSKAPLTLNAPEGIDTDKVKWNINVVNYDNKTFKLPATVDNDGYVTGQAAGTIRVTAEIDGVESNAVLVTVSSKKVSSYITLDKTELNLVKNDVATINATVVPESEAESVKWSSSNEKVATVSGTGAVAEITAGSEEGTAVITAALGSIKATVKVTVTVPIILDENTLVLTSREGVKGQLTATVAGFGMEGKKVIWKSDSDKVAVTASADTRSAEIDPADDLTETVTANITATIEGTEYSDVCSVTVNPQGVVAAPEADFESGEVKAGTRVKLTSATYLADIYYTTDGTEPAPADCGKEGASTKLYTDAIAISEDVTIKAVAYKENLKTSAVSSFAYIVSKSDFGSIPEDLQEKLFGGDSTKVPEGVWYLIGEDDKCYVSGGATEIKMPYTGSAITFGSNIAVFVGTDALWENRDYTVSYANNVNVAGTNAAKAPAVTITGKGNYNSKAVFTFSIVQADMAEATVTTDRVVAVAAGANVKVSATKPSYEFNGRKLSLGKDYVLEYYKGDTVSDEAKVADPNAAFVSDANTVYTIVARAKDGGNFTGAVEKSEYVYVQGIDAAKSVPMSKLKVVNAQGKAITVPYEVKGDSFDAQAALVAMFDNSEGKTATAFVRDGNADLVYGKDFTVSAVLLTDHKSAGKHSFEIAGTDRDELKDGEKSYVGYKTASYEITGTAMKNVKIAGLSTTAEFTGSVISLSDLFNAKDKNLESGWNSVTIYTVDSKTKSKTKLEEGTDYKVSMSNTGAVGKFNVEFVGMGAYSGSVSKTVTVKAYDFKKDTRGAIIVEADPATYAKTGAVPFVTVKYVTEWSEDGKEPVSYLTLEEGSDYTLSFKNNTKIAENEAALNAMKPAQRPTVVVKGKGNFAGTNASAYFTVTKASVSNIDVVAADVTYNEKGKDGYFFVTPKLMDNGKAVTAGKGKDVEAIAKNAYTYYYAEDTTLANGSRKYAGDVVKDSDKPVSGTVIRVEVKVVCSDKSPYSSISSESLLEGNYRIIASGMDISKYTVKVKDPSKLAYNGGNDVELLKEEDLEISYKAKGQTTPTVLSSSDYEIVSITNNRFIGTATVTVRGKGAYGGTKTFTFKIAARSLK